MADIIHMTKTNINKDKIKFSNLHKSFFSELKDTSCDISDSNVIIYDNSKKNSDPACVELRVKGQLYEVYYWDGYSLADKFTIENYEIAILQFKKFSKKLARILSKY